jgi:hypothetical protein
VEGDRHSIESLPSRGTCPSHVGRVGNIDGLSAGQCLMGPFGVAGQRCGVRFLTGEKDSERTWRTGRVARCGEIGGIGVTIAPSSDLRLSTICLRWTGARFARCDNRSAAVCECGLIPVDIAQQQTQVSEQLSVDPKQFAALADSLPPAL